MIYNVEWEPSGGPFFETAFLYAAKFAKGNADVIVAGGSGGQVRMFEHNEDE